MDFSAYARNVWLSLLAREVAAHVKAWKSATVEVSPAVYLS
jgi:hypothetical protein